MPETKIDQLLSKGVSAARAANDKTLSVQKRTAHREQAQQLLVKVTELDDTNVDAWLWLSRVADDHAEEVECLEHVLTIQPQHATAQKRLVKIQRAADVFQCPFCNEPMERDRSVCPHCRTPLVMGCPDCGQLLDVEVSTCSSCGYNMGDYQLGSVYFTLLAMAYQGQHRLGKALETLRIAERLNPDQPDLYRQMGEVLAELGEPAEAIEVLEKAVEQEPDQMGPYMALGRVLQREGQWEQAERIFRIAMRIAPESSETYFALGHLLLHYEVSNLPEARQHLQHAVKLDPYHGLAWVRLGELYERMQQPRSAVPAYYKAAILLPGDDPEQQLIQDRLQILDPQPPPHIARSWSRFSQLMIAPLIIWLLAAVAGIGFRGWQIDPLTVLLGLLLGGLGTFLWVSASQLPQNPIMQALTGSPTGILASSNRWVSAILGVILWLVGVALVLIPF
jgi:tetratricopeptide (TPR) repeat protein